MSQGVFWEYGYWIRANNEVILAHMCGRYTYYNTKRIIDKYDLVPKLNAQVALDLKDNFNVAPSQTMPVIVRGEQEHFIELME